MPIKDGKRTVNRGKCHRVICHLNSNETRCGYLFIHCSESVVVHCSESGRMEEKVELWLTFAAPPTHLPFNRRTWRFNSSLKFTVSSGFFSSVYNIFLAFFYFSLWSNETHLLPLHLHPFRISTIRVGFKGGKKIKKKQTNSFGLVGVFQKIYFWDRIRKRTIFGFRCLAKYEYYLIFK